MPNRPLSGERPSKAVQLFRTNPHIERGTPSLTSIDALRREAQRCARGAELERFWREWYADDMDLSELYPYRLHAAWRIVREMCWLRGLMQERKQPLADTGHVDPSPWEQGFNFFNRLSGVRVVDVICTDHTLPILPPDVPDTHLLPEVGRASDDYEPGEDADLVAWCNLVKFIAQRLNIDRTEYGRYGLAGLTDPHFARAAMPSPDELVKYERLLVREVFDLIRDGGMREAERWLMEKQQLEDHEVNAMLDMARSHAKRLAGLDDMDAFKAMLIARMEGELDRLAEAGDSGRGRAFVMKEIWKIAAHTGREPEEEDLDEMNDVVRQTARTKKPDLLGAPDEVD